MPSLPPSLLRSLPRPIREARSRFSALASYDRGRLHVPPPAAKRRHLLDVFRQHGHDVLVESGTYLGDTCAYFAPHARRVITIEVDADLAARARERFRDTPNVEIVLEDAQQAVPRIMRTLDAPALIWLDGHYSGEGTGRGAHDEPAVEIIRSLGKIGGIGGIGGSTIVVDDLRTFGREAGFPSLTDLVSTTREAFPDADVVAGLDCLILRI